MTGGEDDFHHEDRKYEHHLSDVSEGLGTGNFIVLQRSRITSESNLKSESHSTRYIVPLVSCSVFRLVILDHLMLHMDCSPVDIIPVSTPRTDRPETSTIHKQNPTTGGVTVSPSATHSMSALGIYQESEDIRSEMTTI